MLSSAYEANYGRMLDAVARAPEVATCPRLAAFWPCASPPAVGGLLVVGRATNKWEPALEPGCLVATGATATAAASARAESEHETLEAWFARWPGARRSAFWRVALAVARGLFPGPAPFSRLAWTELAKLAPFDGGNPSESLWSAQRQFVFELFQRELEELQPRFVLALTGMGWFESTAQHCGITLQAASRPLEAVGEWVPGRCRVIVSPHPQGKREDLIIAAALEELSRPSPAPGGSGTSSA